MCLDCGCNEPDDDHGDSRHITRQNLRDAASASGISEDEALRNMQSTWQSASQTGASGQGQYAGTGGVGGDAD
jgi:hypothetical protein